MSPKNDDIPPKAYKYSWDAESELPLQEFLTKFIPSMVQNDGTKPWIWVKGTEPLEKKTGPEQVAEEAKAIAEASKLLKDVTEKVENIKNDETIPIRSNKKTGAKSKKELREQVQSETAKKLNEIAVKYGYVHGKWLIFAPADKVDLIWSSIATSIVSGPLHSTPAYLAKVSTSSEDENSRGQHLICVYLPDVFDKAEVTEVMKVLLRNHGATLSGVKADLYTVIGIDSKHPSGIASTVWKNAAILPEKEAKELKDAFFAEIATRKSAGAEAAGGKSAPEAKLSTEATSSAETKEPLEKPVPSKPRMKRKAASDPFGSSDEDETVRTEPKKIFKIESKRAQEDADTEDKERPKKKRAVGK